MYSEILKFWFEEIKPAQWFKKSDDFDQHIRERFSHIHEQAVRCELFSWRESPQGRLAEIIVLDQFSRNMFRDSPLAFSNDQMTLTLAQEAVAQGVDQLLETTERGFLYLPYMHSESLAIHEIAEQLYTRHGVETTLEWELKHKTIIERFGRFPHRNEILGRTSTREEIEFLKQPNSSF
ncbi:DUF924 family protein [Desulforhopalus sp. 52FAK]